MIELDEYYDILERAALQVERYAHTELEIDEGECNSDTCGYVCRDIRRASDRVRQLKTKQPEEIR